MKKKIAKQECKYCHRSPDAVYSEELLCSRHYKKIYLNQDKIIPVKTVPKTALEWSLKKKYMKLLDKCMLIKDYEVLAIEFKKSLKAVIAENPRYENP